MKSKPTWGERLRASTKHEVKPAPMDFAGMKAGQIMLVPSATMVDRFIRAIPEGVAIDVKTLRSRLAKRYRAQVTCPITTGFHLKTVAEAAYEALNQGVKLREITPIWRVLDERTPTTKKLSYDAAFITEQRAREGL
jgi:hypothetical protein